MRDELFSQLRDLETLAREVRTLLQADPDVEKMAGEDAFRVAEALLAARDANAALSPLHQALHLRAMQRAVERSASVRDAAQSDLERALGFLPPGTPLPEHRGKQRTAADRSAGFQAMERRTQAEVNAAIRRLVANDTVTAERLTDEAYEQAWRAWETTGGRTHGANAEAYVYRSAVLAVLRHYGDRVPVLADEAATAVLRSASEFEANIAKLEEIVATLRRVAAEEGRDVSGEVAAVHARVREQIVEFYRDMFPLSRGWHRGNQPDSGGGLSEWYPRDGGERRPDTDPPAGGGGVPVAPRPVPVLAGGAARTFEEAQEPARNP